MPQLNLKAMKTFIKVTEIWIPDKERTQLEFGSGLYGGLIDFKAASEQQQFAYNEGLPGKAWAAGHPIVLTKFEHSYFQANRCGKKSRIDLRYCHTRFFRRLSDGRCRFFMWR